MNTNDENPLSRESAQVSNDHSDDQSNADVLVQKMYGVKRDRKKGKLSKRFGKKKTRTAELVSWSVFIVALSIASPVYLDVISSPYPEVTSWKVALTMLMGAALAFCGAKMGFRNLFFVGIFCILVPFMIFIFHFIFIFMMIVALAAYG